MTNEERAKLGERLREWPMREQVKTYDHTFHIAETGSSYTTKRAIPQSPKPVMFEAADQIEADGQRIAELEAALNGLLDEITLNKGDVLDSRAAGMAYAALLLRGE